MYLHIGNSVVVPMVEITGIYSMELKKSASTKEFLDFRDEKKVVSIEDNKKAKSFIVTRDMLYYSSISPNTLRKRAELWSQVDGKKRRLKKDGQGKRHL